MKVEKIKYSLLIVLFFVFVVGDIVFSAGGDCATFPQCEDWQEQNPYPDCSCYPDTPPSGGGTQSYSLNMNQLNRTNNVLNVRYTISISYDDYDDYNIDCGKVTASNTSGPLNINSCDNQPQPLSNTIRGEIGVNAPESSAVTISINEGFFEAIDDNGNVIGRSSAKGMTFQPAGVFGNVSLVKQRRENNTLWIDITNNVENANNYTYDHRANKIQINNGLHAEVHSSQTQTNKVVHSIEIAGASTGLEIAVHIDPGFVIAYDSTNNPVGYSNPGGDVFVREETEPEPESTCEALPGGQNNNDCTFYGPSYYYSGGCCFTDCDHAQIVGGGCEDGYMLEGSCCVAASCERPAQNDSCANYGGIYYPNDYGCCIRGDACVGPDENDLCPEGYAPDSDGCCSLISVACGENQVSQGGGACIDCIPGETIPNSEHTKCICDSSKKCCGIQLNTVVPFIGDCIEMNTDSSRGDTTSVTSVTAFPILVQGLMKILMSAIMVFSFLMVIIAGLAMITGAFGGSGYNKGKTIIKNVIISLILLGCSGLILSLINPSFFGG